jgi:light-regulated signal transduction histidine kinase (bacteriophytochrome)
VQTILNELKQKNPQRQVEFRIKNGVFMQCDVNLIKIMFENLLNNAWKYTSKNSETRIEFDWISGEKPIYFIRDNGVGFPQLSAEKLFHPFTRLHSDKDFPGTGVGLATVKRIVDRHGGRIWAESNANEGATFYIEL